MIHTSSNFDIGLLKLRSICRSPEASTLLRLDLSNFGLQTLPREIVALKELQTLNLQNNYLSIIPEEIGQLSNLRVLDLRFNNDIKTLPKTMQNLTQLRRLEHSMDDFSEVRRIQSWLPKCEILHQISF